jgi:hypothetical protein
MGAAGTGRGVVLVIVGVGMQSAPHVGERVMAHLFSVFILIRTSTCVTATLLENFTTQALGVLGM